MRFVTVMVRLDRRRLGQSQEFPHLGQATRDIGQPGVDRCGHVLRAKELVQIQPSARIQKLRVQVHERRSIQANPGPVQNVRLDGDIVQMVIPDPGGRLDLDEAPCVVGDPLQYVHPDGGAVILEHPLEDSRYARIEEESRALAESVLNLQTLCIHHRSSREEAARQLPHLNPHCEPRPHPFIRPAGERWSVRLQIQPLGALEAGKKAGLGKARFSGSSAWLTHRRFAVKELAQMPSA
jgi:hypothetical protein